MTVTVVSPYLSIKVYSFSCIFIFVCVLSCLAVSYSLRHPGLWPSRLLCPWNFPGENTCGVAISSSRGSSWPRDQTQVACISCISRQITTEPPGRPIFIFTFHLIHIITIWVVNGTASILYTCGCVCVCVCVCVFTKGNSKIKNPRWSSQKMAE